MIFNHLPHNLSGFIDFESAARWCSFRLAAQELHKTPAAVSQQIKQLETVLGFALFIRHTRQVTLTVQGRELAEEVRRLLFELDRQVAALQVANDDGARLLVSATHSFAMKCLLPLLHRFTERYPGIDLRIESNDALVELGEGGCDLAIRYQRYSDDGDPRWLCREHQIVVYSPALVAVEAPTIGELARFPLLHEGSPAAWLRLLQEAGLQRAGFDFSRSFSHAGLLVQAAVAGQGVALAPRAIAAEDLRQGRLRRVHDVAWPSDYGYKLLRAQAKTNSDKVSWFEAWLRGEMMAMLSGATALPPC